MSSFHRPGRGCTCGACDRKRAYNRKRYAEKHKGVPRNRADSTPMKPAASADEPVRGREPRWVLTEGKENSVVHWLPKGVRKWTCPDCGAFLEALV